MSELFDNIQPNEIRYFNITNAIVTNINDDKHFGRVKVKYALTEDESDWLRVMTPMAGKDYGMFFFPSVGDEVIVAFTDNSCSNAYVLGSLWNGENTQPIKIEDDGKNDIRMIKSKAGHTIIFNDDTEKEPGITIKTNQGLILNLLDKDGGKTINLSDGDKNKIEIKSDDGKGTFETKTELIIKSDKSTIKLGSNGIALEGEKITIKAGQQLSIEGSSAQIKATSNLTLNGGSATNVKGSVVKIN